MSEYGGRLGRIWDDVHDLALDAAADGRDRLGAALVALATKVATRQTGARWEIALREFRRSGKAPEELYRRAGLHREPLKLSAIFGEETPDG